jgi:hypothetical protein
MKAKTTETFISSETLDHTILPIRFKIIWIVAILFITTILIYSGNRQMTIKLSFKDNIQSHTNFRYRLLHSNYSSSERRFDVVLSYYKENVTYVARFISYLRNISTLQTLKPFIIVYNKNSNINNTYLKNATKADIVHQLPNVGRESGTYLYHIIENYDTLADHILFSQAGVEDMSGTGLADWFSDRLEKQFNSSVGYMPLVAMKWMSIYDCGLNVNNNLLRLAELWAIIEQTICPPDKQAVSRN